MQNFQADAIIASDIHLVDLDDHRGRTLLKVIETVEQSQVDHLILLGDIFDFCLGSHKYYQHKYQAMGEALERCVASGTRVTYLEGNHEFRIRDFGWKGVEFITAETTFIQLKSGHCLQLGHGDMIFSHNRYKAFRRVVKSKWFTSTVGLLPGKLMNWLATKAAEASRAQDEYRTIHHDRILGAAYSWLEKGRGDFGLFGHFHVPYAELRRDGALGGIFSMNCWDEPNFLVIREGRFFRYLKDHRGVWQESPAESFFARPDTQPERPAFVPLNEGVRLETRFQPSPFDQPALEC